MLHKAMSGRMRCVYCTLSYPRICLLGIVKTKQQHEGRQVKGTVLGQGNESCRVVFIHSSNHHRQQDE